MTSDERSGEGFARRKRGGPAPDEAQLQARQRELVSERSALPIWQCRDALVAEARASRVLIVVGETGSGKSTQLPQFLLQARAREGCAVRGERCFDAPTNRLARLAAGRYLERRHGHSGYAASPRGGCQPCSPRGGGDRHSAGATARAELESP